MRRQGPLGPPPARTSPATSRSMKSNRGRGTAPELRLRKALRDAGLRAFRTNFAGAPGRPDVAFPSERVAVMVYGDFWHRCPKHRLPLPKNHRDFWRTKFALNKSRDLRTRMALKKAGWRVVEVWECEVREALQTCVARVQTAVRATTPSPGAARRTQT